MESYDYTGDLRFNQGITVAIFGINGGKYGRGETENWIKYKKSWGSPLCSITLLSSFAICYNKNQIFSFFWIIMTQGQLLGNSGDVRDGEGTRKRMKISVPHFDNSALIKTYSKTLIGRCMNPPEQEMKALIQNVPKIWKLEDRVVGTDLGFGKFQFDFETEEEIETVLKLQPYHFDYWMLALARWQPKKTQLFPSEITFWVRVLGVPMEFKTAPTFESIGDALGRTVSVDLDNSRVQVVVDAFQQLCFETTVDFKGGEFYEGEEVAISLRYEKLFGFCPICSSLCHKEEKCPLAKPEVKTSPARKRETGEGNGGWFEVGKHDDRARSYKGVVINGNQSHQHRERDHRDYYGKGKGKVVEENDSKWVKVAEKGNKGAFHNRGNYRGDGDGSRQRISRREEPRMTGQDGRLKATVGHTGDQRSQRGSRVEAQEEGEITNAEGTDKHLPSQNFQEELARTQATGTEVVSDPMDAENGLQMVQSLVENTTALEEDRVMDMDEIKAVFLEHGIDMDAADDLQDGSDGEFEKAVLELEQENGENVHAEEELATGEEEKLMEDGELAKRQGTRKRLFKTTIGTAASTKLRSASAMVSPRKRGASKPGTRHGEMGKQMEIKGTSNPKTGPQKP
ncbi:uncharacterized protein LOC108869592 isoform X1 [Brassica rapa]|nr:uncharacterized protein LOC108869592 isoform X1 [Brassica rapa]